MNIRGLLLVIACLFLAFANVEAQENMPAISPTATITTATGETQEVTEYSGSAPLQVHFAPNVENPEGYEAYYEWRFYKEGTSIEEPYLVRHEEETDFSFNEAGGHCIALIAYFMNVNDSIV